MSGSSFNDWLRSKIAVWLTKYYVNADVWLLWIIVQLKFNDCQLARILLRLTKWGIAIQTNILSSDFSLFNTKLKASRSDLVWLSIYFHERLQIPCVFFFKTPVECYSVSIRLICRAIRTTKSADKMLVPQHWIIGF